MYLVQIQEVSANQDPLVSTLNEYVLWRTRVSTKHRSEAIECKEILKKYYTYVRIVKTQKTVELTDDLQELL